MNKVQHLWAMCISWSFVFVVPFMHITILWHFWRTKHYKVDREGCTCDCWDAVFKGPYEEGVAYYKHFYFNATIEMLKIWAIIITGLLTLYECTKYCAELFIGKRLRFSMFALIIASLYPHYYSWWNYINYINDEFYDEWNHQLFYTTTEIISTGVALYLCNNQCKVKPYMLLIIISIGITHVMGAGLDQFVINVIFRRGNLHQVLRDFGLIIPDVLNVIIPLQVLVLMKKDGRFRRSIKDKLFILQLFLSLIFIVVSVRNLTIQTYSF